MPLETRRSRRTWACVTACVLPVATLLSAQTNEALKPHQAISPDPPPQSPATFDPDPNKLQLPYDPRFGTNWSHSVTVISNAPAPQFNPDPGASLKPPPPAPRPPLFRDQIELPPRFTPPPLAPGQSGSRENVRQVEIHSPRALPPGSYGSEPLPPGLELPRSRTRRNLKIDETFHAPHYSAPGDYPTNTVPRPDRWRIGFVPWRRYTSGVTEQPYESPATRLWHPYEQSILKGDAPIIGQDIFLSLTASATTELEFRRVPTPSGVSAEDPDASEFFGDSEQIGLQNFFAFGAELFKGETAFKPVEWAIRLEPVFNLNHVVAEETGVVSPNPQRGTDRTRHYLALQQAFGEIHLRDLSDNYDFMAFRAGSQPFNSDFRGFIFNDINLGARFFGNWLNNRCQYNAALFDLREKDTNSELNTFDDRGQEVLVANIYWQDFFWKGYTAQASFHANFDHGGTHYDENGNIVRPAPIGTVREHDVTAFYFGWAGDGHIGRLNLSHAFYQVVGRDDFNGLAGRPVDINAQLAALELSYDRDWVRYKASFFYASGDDSPEDGSGTGFDTILDNPNFTGGPFSYWTRQGFNLAGTSVNLKQRGSLVPNLRTSKTQGQANFVNPGVMIFGLGSEMELTPKLRLFLNANYIRLSETAPIRTALLTPNVDNEIGFDLSLGVQYRPLLTDNIIISSGFGALVPGRGFKDIYRRNHNPVPGFPDDGQAGQADDFLYSGLLAVTLTY